MNPNTAPPPGYAAIAKMVKLEDADCSKPEDKAAIFSAVRNKVPGGFNGLNKIVQEVLIQWDMIDSILNPRGGPGFTSAEEVQATQRAVVMRWDKWYDFDKAVQILELMEREAQRFPQLQLNPGVRWRFAIDYARALVKQGKNLTAADEHFR